jgi:3-deoxy-D-manno-octulosonic-acid transferase
MPQGLFQHLLLLSYSVLWLLVLPVALLRLIWRARRQPAYLRHLRERFGGYRVRAPGAVIWVHAVSVGETRAAEPLIRAMLERWPNHTVVLTHMTPTGRTTSKSLFGGDSRVLRVYLPYDFGFFVARFLRHFRPAFGVVMETELWPSLLATCHRRQVPVLLANARLSARSARRYACFPALSRLTLGALSAIAAQTAADASRFASLGARRTSIIGNIKFDIEPPAAALALAEDFRARIGARPVVLAASTREGEEAAIIDAFARKPANVLLILAPRHPQRFDQVEALARARGFTVQRRSDGAPVTADTQIWLGDSMGEMFAYYAVAKVALIGGSWFPFGGQNPIEACVVGTPVLIGPHTFNFQAVVEEAVTAGAARRHADVEAAMLDAFELLDIDAKRITMAEAGRAFAAHNRGATTRTLDLLAEIVER